MNEKTVHEKNERALVCSAMVKFRSLWVCQRSQHDHNPKTHVDPDYTIGDCIPTHLSILRKVCPYK